MEHQQLKSNTDIHWPTTLFLAFAIIKTPSCHMNLSFRGWAQMLRFYDQVRVWPHHWQSIRLGISQGFKIALDRTSSCSSSSLWRMTTSYCPPKQLLYAIVPFRFENTKMGGRFEVPTLSSSPVSGHVACKMKIKAQVLMTFDLRPCGFNGNGGISWDLPTPNHWGVGVPK